LKALLAQTNSLTPGIEKTLAEASQLRLECQKAMLRHFMEVSQTMPPPQGRRYLAWVEERTFLPDYGMRMERKSEVRSPGFSLMPFGNSSSFMSELSEW
jgi:hypothetical protein